MEYIIVCQKHLISNSHFEWLNLWLNASLYNQELVTKGALYD